MTTGKKLGCWSERREEMDRVDVMDLVDLVDAVDKERLFMGCT